VQVSFVDAVCCRVGICRQQWRAEASVPIDLKVGYQPRQCVCRVEACQRRLLRQIRRGRFIDHQKTVLRLCTRLLAIDELGQAQIDLRQFGAVAAPVPQGEPA